MTVDQLAVRIANLHSIHWDDLRAGEKDYYLRLAKEQIEREKRHAERQVAIAKESLPPSVGQSVKSADAKEDGHPN